MKILADICDHEQSQRSKPEEEMSGAELKCRSVPRDGGSRANKRSSGDTATKTKYMSDIYYVTESLFPS